MTVALGITAVACGGAGPVAPAASSPASNPFAGIEQPAVQARTSALAQQPAPPQRQEPEPQSHDDLDEKMRSGIESSCSQGQCRIDDKCVERSKDAPSCVAARATKRAVNAASLRNWIVDQGILRFCEGSELYLAMDGEFDRRDWQSKFTEAEFSRAKALFVPCDEKVTEHPRVPGISLVPYKCYSLPLREDEKKFCTDARLRNLTDSMFKQRLEACITRFAESGPPAPGCGGTAPSMELMSQADYERNKASCEAECTAKGPQARKKFIAEAANGKAREAKGTQDRARRDTCVTKCEQDSDRKCAGLPDHGLVGQKSLCLRDALKACCGPCGASINTNNYSMCTH